jgi:hypothetical protein
MNPSDGNMTVTEVNDDTGTAGTIGTAFALPSGANLSVSNVITGNGTYSTPTGGH